MLVFSSVLAGFILGVILAMLGMKITLALLVIVFILWIMSFVIFGYIVNEGGEEHGKRSKQTWEGEKES